MRKLSAFAVFLVAMIPAMAIAQSSVTVLLPEQFQVGDELTTQLREHLLEAVTAHPDYTVSELPPQTLSQLLFALGCEEVDEECMSLAGEVLESDYLIWGDLGAAGQTYLVELTLYDFAANDEVIRLSRAIESTPEEFVERLPIFARGVVYGEIGEVTIITTPPDAVVEFDSRIVDQTSPVVLTGLEFGAHVLRVTRDEHYDHSEIVMIDVEGVTVAVDLTPLTEEIDVSTGRIWTWVTLGTGVAFVGAGMAFAFLTQSTQDSFDDEASRVQVDTARVQDLQDEGETNALLTNIFFGTGIAAIAAGVVLFFVEGSDDSPQTDSDAPVSVVPQFNSHGAGISLDIEF